MSTHPSPQRSGQARRTRRARAKTTEEAKSKKWFLLGPECFYTPSLVPLKPGIYLLWATAALDISNKTFCSTYKSISNKCRNKKLYPMWHLILSRYLCLGALIEIFIRYSWKLFGSGTYYYKPCIKQNRLWVRLLCNYIMMVTRVNKSALQVR